MGKQYHFVVVFDEDENEFIVDYDTQDVKFNQMPIYDDTADEWLGWSEDIDDDNSTYNRAADAVYMAMRDLQLRERI